MNLAQELYLCALPADGVIASPKVPCGIGAALAAELILAGRVRIDGDAAVLTDPAPTSDELLDGVLSDWTGQEARRSPLTQWLSGLGPGILPRVAERVVAEGLATCEKGQRRRFDPQRADWYRLTPAGLEPRARLRAMLLGECEPDSRGLVLVALATACDLIKLHVPREAHERVALHAAALAHGDGLPEAVREAIAASQAATAAAPRAEHSPTHAG